MAPSSSSLNVLRLSTAATVADLQADVRRLGPDVHRNQHPLHVTIDGYNHDARELWQIPEVIALCRRIIESGLLSLLIVRPLDIRLWGAVDVWACANGGFSIAPTPGGAVMDLNGDGQVDRFRADLEASNARCEALLRLPEAVDPSVVRDMASRQRRGVPLTPEQQRFNLDVLMANRAVPVAPPLTTGHHRDPIVDLIVSYRIRARRNGLRWGRSAAESMRLFEPYARPSDHRWVAVAFALGPQLVVEEVGGDVYRTLRDDRVAPQSVPRRLNQPFLSTYPGGGVAVLPCPAGAPHLGVLAVEAGTMEAVASPDGETVFYFVVWRDNDDSPDFVAVPASGIASLFDSEDEPGRAASIAVKLAMQHEAIERPLVIHDEHRRTRTVRTQPRGIEEITVGWTVRVVHLRPAPTPTPNVPPPESGPPSSAPEVADAHGDRHGVEIEITIEAFGRWQPCGPGRRQRRWTTVRGHTRTIVTSPNVRIRVRH